MKESFGRDMSDIKQKITTVSSFFLQIFEALTIFEGKNRAFMVSWLVESKCRAMRMTKSSIEIVVVQYLLKHNLFLYSPVSILQSRQI